MALTCSKHVDQTAVQTCSQCGRLACGDCLVELATGTFCKTCLEARFARPARPIGGFVRLVLSIFPGLGHLYMGLFNRGFQIMAGTALGAVMIGMVFGPMIGKVVAPLIGLWILLAVFFSIFDAREAHLRLAQGLEVPDLQLVDLRTHWHPRWVAYVLITLGVLALYNMIINDVLRLLVGYTQAYFQAVSIIRTVTTAALAIGAGLWLLGNGAARPGGGQTEAAALRPDAAGGAGGAGGKGDAA